MNEIIPNFLHANRKSVASVIVFFALIMGQTCLGQVTLPHHDAFNYTIGQSLSAQTGGSWLSVGAETDDILITSGSLEFPVFASSTGNKVSFAGGGRDVLKTFTSTNSGSVYYSYLLNITSVTGFTGGTFAGFVNAGNIAPGSGDVRGCIWIRPSTAGNFNIGFTARSNGAPVYGVANYPIGTPVLLVVSYQFVAGNNNDICRLYINPAPGQAMPTENQSVTMSSDPANLGGFYIRQNSGASTPACEFDELRFGLNWADVTPVGPVKWNGTAWANISGPTSDLDAQISGNFSTAANGSFTAKKLTVDSGVLTVSSGTSITVVNELINNLAATNIIIENNANLIQNGTVNSNDGDITIHRNSSPLYRLDYTLWSSPVSGNQTLEDFSPLTLSNRFYELLTTSNTFSAVSSASTFDLAKGYMIRTPNNWLGYSQVATPLAYPGTFVGLPNDGDISHSISTAGNSFNAVGNPYPSAINMDLFIDANSSNITGTLWFLRNTADPTAITQGVSSYSTCTTAGCTLNNGHSYANQDFISTGQGFIVKATSSTLLFNNSMRANSNTDQFFRNADSNTAISRFWLNVSNSSNANLAEKLIAYTPNATTGYDYGLDGRSFGDAQIELLSIIDNEDYVIQARPVFDITDVVVLKFKTNVADTFTISLANFDGLFDAQNIYLKDNLLNIVTNLNETSYSFASEAGIFDTRFEVVYQPVTLGIPSDMIAQNNVVVYKSSSDIMINAGSILIENVKIFDIRGRLLAQKSNINNSQTKLNMKSDRQILLVKVTSTDGHSITKKIIN